MENREQGTGNREWKMRDTGDGSLRASRFAILGSRLLVFHCLLSTLERR